MISSLFIDNKYTRVYYNIVSHALAMKRPRKGLRTYRRKNNISNLYFEDHHIVPKSLGGSNDKTNYVPLTAKEHFICHLLLSKMCKTREHRHKMSIALFMMTKKTKNSRLYERIRNDYITINTSLNLGKSVDKDTKEKMSMAAKARGFTTAHRDSINKTRCKPRTIIDPCGNIHTVINVAAFAREHNLNRQTVNALLTGEKKSLRSGWKAPS